MVSYPELEKLKSSIGKTMKIKGMKSEIIWPHIISFQPNYLEISYFDLKDDFQVVIYSRDKIPFNHKLEVVGKVIKITGPSKRSKAHSKVDEEYSEYQILVESWKIIDSKKS